MKKNEQTRDDEQEKPKKLFANMSSGSRKRKNVQEESTTTVENVTTFTNVCAKTIVVSTTFAILDHCNIETDIIFSCLDTRTHVYLIVDSTSTVRNKRLLDIVLERKKVAQNTEFTSGKTWHMYHDKKMSSNMEVMDQPLLLGDHMQIAHVEFRQQAGVVLVDSRSIVDKVTNGQLVSVELV